MWSQLRYDVFCKPQVVAFSPSQPWCLGHFRAKFFGPHGPLVESMQWVYQLYLNTNRLMNIDDHPQISVYIY